MIGNSGVSKKLREETRKLNVTRNITDGDVDFLSPESYSKVFSQNYD